MHSHHNLEVIIRQNESMFEALCSAFPKCIGRGITQDESLANLSESIAGFITSVATESFQSILLSNKYTEVLLDVSKKDKEQRRVYNLDPTVASFHKTVLFKIKPLQEPQILPTEINNDINTLFQPREPITHSGDPIANITTIIARIVPQNQEGFGFGFPLSFN